MPILARSFLPSTAVLEMTYRCNHECRFCSCPWFAADGRFPCHSELTTAQWKNIIAKLCDMGIASFAFTGGEALLRDDLFDIIAHAAQCRAEHIETKEGELRTYMGAPGLYLISNGKLVTEETLARLKEHEVNLAMSLPGLDTFKWHTGSDTADHVLKMFGKAKAAGLRTVCNVTVTRKNIHELYETLAAGLIAGADQILMNRFLPGGRGLTGAEEMMIDGPMLTQMLDIAEEVLTKAGRFGSLGTEVPRCWADPAKYKRITVGTRCSAALEFFVIDPSGFVRVCNHSQVRLHHFDEIEKVKLDPYWTTFTQRRYLPKECGGCRDAADCDGGCREAAHIVGGKIDSPDTLPPVPRNL